MDVIRDAFRRIRFSLACVFTVTHQLTGDLLKMSTTHASEELLATPLPELIRDLGLAVAGANKAISEVENLDIVYTINSAEIEVNVAISIEKSNKAEITAGGTLSVFSVNASYANTYGYKEEASSRIKLTLAAVPKAAVPAAG